MGFVIYVYVHGGVLYCCHSLGLGGGGNKEVDRKAVGSRVFMIIYASGASQWSKLEASPNQNSTCLLLHHNKFWRFASNICEKTLIHPLAENVEYWILHSSILLTGYTFFNLF